ncbi:MAG: bifunctional folylpolyglutamate synthase/dihydrofolate synthase [Firmicutes bacterium]|nr:bifunctional folylpolyglutamate synthase/dihydrofolate synthase [[Eubacterium] siraeum]MCM1487782.1 bifunctional folylpolyglutamate synthase/dihydrofolate synthase [Bacillota bacterium]
MLYKQAISFLNSFTKSGKPVTDLSRFKALMTQLGDPQNRVKYIHIAGTNGKGSVSEYAALALEYCGFKTGKFTSPYINKVEERIQLNGQPISEDNFALYLTGVKNAAEKTGCSDYSQFEILNAAAFLYYAEKNCDYGVLEAGIGGLLDCTNIVHPVLSVITTVDLDHCQLLGDTAEKIAAHKAGIIKENTPSVTAPFQREGVLKVLSDKAAETGSALVIPDNGDISIIGTSLDGTDFSYKGKLFHTKMCGRHQAINGTAAIEALRILNVDESVIERALKNAAVPARTERIGGWLIDGAHNPSGAAAAADLLKSADHCTKALVVGMLASKDWQSSLKLLVPCFDHVIAADFFSPSAVPKEELADFVKALGKPCITAHSPQDAVHSADRLGDDLKAVCGSLYLCGEMRRELLSL